MRRVKVEAAVWPEIRDRIDLVGLAADETRSQTVRRWVAEGLTRDEKRLFTRR